MSTIQTIGHPEVRAEPGRRRRRPLRDVLLPVDGTFDLGAALRTAAAVRARSVGARVTVDLRRARIEDAALAAFVREVASQPVAMVGLSRHHERLLRYLENGSGAEREAEE
jgi:hypothetical protein